MKSLDIAYAPTPGQYALDLTSQGCQVAALYVINYDTPTAHQEPNYFSYLRGQGFRIDSIVVPGNGSPSLQDILGALLAAGVGPGDRVELDIEPFSYPPAAWVAAWQQAMRGQRFSPGQYSAARDQTRYGGFDWYRLATLDGVDVPPPAGYVGLQWGQVDVDGRVYDVSNWLDSFWGTFEPPIQGDTMTPEQDQMLQEIHQTIQGGLLPQLGNLQRIGSLPTADQVAAAVAAALPAGSGADAKTIATAVLQLFQAQMAK